MWEPDFTLLSEPVKVSPPAVPLQMAPPPKRCMTESESVTDVVRVARVPYAERPVVLPKPRDRPFRHAGLMREIGGVQGFLNVMRGTHRFPAPTEGG